MLKVWQEDQREPAKLKIHERIHNGEKPFSCSKCDYKCSDPRYMKSMKALTQMRNNLSVQNVTRPSGSQGIGRYMREFDQNFNDHLNKYIYNWKLKIFSAHINNMKPYSQFCFISEMWEGPVGPRRGPRQSKFVVTTWAIESFHGLFCILHSALSISEFLLTVGAIGFQSEFFLSLWERLNV